MSQPALKVIEREGMDKSKALDAALGQIERAFGKGSIMRMVDVSNKMQVEAIPTGSIALDLALWAVWALNIRNGYSLLLQYFVGTIAVVLVTRVAIVVALSLIDRGFRIGS